MISVDGAALIAQMVPVGLLIIAVEARAIRDPRPLLRYILLFGGLAAVVFGGGAILFCALSVALQEPVPPVESVVVIVGAIVVYAVAFVAMVRLVLQTAMPRRDEDD